MGFVVLVCTNTSSESCVDCFLETKNVLSAKFSFTRAPLSSSMCALPSELSVEEVINSIKESDADKISAITTLISNFVTQLAPFSFSFVFFSLLHTPVWAIVSMNYEHPGAHARACIEQILKFSVKWVLSQSTMVLLLYAGMEEVLAHYACTLKIKICTFTFSFLHHRMIAKSN